MEDKQTKQSQAKETLSTINLADLRKIGTYLNIQPHTTNSISELMGMIEGELIMSTVSLESVTRALDIVVPSHKDQTKNEVKVEFVVVKRMPGIVGFDGHAKTFKSDDGMREFFVSQHSKQDFNIDDYIVFDVKGKIHVSIDSTISVNFT